MNHLARPIRAGEAILVRLVAFAQNELSGAHFSLEILLEIVLEVRILLETSAGSAKRVRLGHWVSIFPPNLTQFCAISESHMGSLVSNIATQ